MSQDLLQTTSWYYSRVEYSRTKRFS